MRKSRIRKITLRKERNGRDSSTLVAIIKKNGDLMLEGYDFGEAPETFYGDSDYEYWRTVKKKYKDTTLLWLIKERFDSDSDYADWLKGKGIRKVKKKYKDAILLWLIKERFDTDSAFKDWLGKKRIPRKRFRGDSDYEYWRTIKRKHKDATLLWLIKERFDSDSVFADWLGEKDIPSEFMSWI